MGLTALQQRIGKLIVDGINVEIPSIDIDLFESGVLDSLAFVELLLSLEREFGIRVSLEELEIDRFRSIERIAEFVAGRLRLNGEQPSARGAHLGPPEGA